MGTAFFRGASNVKVDDKGRVGIPSRYRDALSSICNGALVLTADLNGCILIYPKYEWSVVEKKLLELPSLNRQSRFLQRLMIGHASECDVDGQGRILLPTPLRKHAGIEKSSLLIGQGRKFELWSQKRWNKEIDVQLANEAEQTLDDVLGDIRF